MVPRIADQKFCPVTLDFGGEKTQCYVLAKVDDCTFYVLKKIPPRSAQQLTIVLINSLWPH